MRRIGMAVLAGTLALAGAGGGAGCARAGAVAAPGPGAQNTTAPSPTETTSGSASDRAAVYIAVLRRYLTSADSSFGENPRFPAVYVLDQTDPGAAGLPQRGGGTEPTSGPLEPIAAADRAAILAALTDLGPIRFIADRSEVIESPDGCAQVRGGGVMIKLAPPVGGPDRVEVGIHGFVACLGATWFTYVVERAAGRWSVAGTTGPMAVA